MSSGKAGDRPGEFELIAKLFAPLAREAPGAFALTDDAAVLSPPPGHELVLKTDAIVEGVHFLHDDPPETIAQKALRVNLSDLAAKGAIPAGYLMALLLPDWPGLSWLEAFVSGLAKDQREFGLSLMGGDTSATPGPLAIAISAIGLVPSGTMIRRAGARPGDRVFVSGTLGDAATGLAIRTGRACAVPVAVQEWLVRRYRVPEPRLALGQALRGVASAALDVSDGLVADLGHVADASQVRILICEGKIPLSPALAAMQREDPTLRRRAATAGDDYEIAFCAHPSQRTSVISAGRSSGVVVS